MTDVATEEAFSEHNRRRLKFALQAVCLVTLVASLLLGVQFGRKAHADESEKRAELLRITEEAAAQIDRILKPVSQATTDLAARLTRGEVGAATVEPALRAMVQSNEAFFGGTVALPAVRPRRQHPALCPLLHPQGPGRQPAADPARRRLRLHRAGHRRRALTDWYVSPWPKAAGRLEPAVFRPRAGEDHDHLLGVFMSAGPTPQKNGVVTLDVSMDRLKQIIRDLRLGPGGFGALTTSEGIYLYHPDERLVRQRKTLAPRSRTSGTTPTGWPWPTPPRRAAAASCASQHDHGARSWLAYAPVPSTGWSLQITFVRNDVPRQVEEVRQQGIWIAVALIGFLASLSLLLLRAHEGRTPPAVGGHGHGRCCCWPASAPSGTWR